MKKKLLLIIVFCVSVIAVKSQIPNVFIRKGKFIFYPQFYIFNNGIDRKTFGLSAEIGYVPVDRLEIRTGVDHYFGYLNSSALRFNSRYYLLKSKFTIFPEINYALSYSFIDKSLGNYFDVGLGMGYYGILKRIGLDFIINYVPEIKFFDPNLRLKILLGKIK